MPPFLGCHPSTHPQRCSTAVPKTAVVNDIHVVTGLAVTEALSCEIPAC
jgi:hypothetical protein